VGRDRGGRSGRIERRSEALAVLTRQGHARNRRVPGAWRGHRFLVRRRRSSVRRGRTGAVRVAGGLGAHRRRAAVPADRRGRLQRDGPRLPRVGDLARIGAGRRPLVPHHRHTRERGGAARGLRQQRPRCARVPVPTGERAAARPAPAGRRDPQRSRALPRDRDRRGAGERPGFAPDGHWCRRNRPYQPERHVHRARVCARRAALPAGDALLPEERCGDSDDHRLAP